MDELEKALYTKWISRFGADKVKDLAEGLDAGRSIKDKSEAIVGSKSTEELSSLLLEGFKGFFHQTIYFRTAEKAQENMVAFAMAKDRGDVKMEELGKTETGFRCLLFVSQKMEFLSEQREVVDKKIPFPIVITLAGKMITVQVLTMQSTLKTWSEIVGEKLARMLTSVKADSLYDQALTYLMHLKLDIGHYVDYSGASIALMKHQDINTYSGTREVGTVGSSKHDTVRGKGKQSLRQSMPDKFKDLTEADKIINAEIEFMESQSGMTKGAKVALYPTVGKIAFRSNLEGCDPDEFIATLADS